MTFATQLSAAFTPIAAVYDSASVSRALSWSQSFVEGFCDRSFDYVANHVSIVDPKPYRSARLTRWPVLNVESVYALLPAANNSQANLTIVGSGSGGTFAAGTYYWVVCGVSATVPVSAGSNTSTTFVAEQQMSNEVVLTLSGSTSSATLSWAAVPGMVSYNVYRGNMSGAENRLVANVTGTTYTDTGTAGTPQVPTTGLFWQQLFNYAFMPKSGLLYDTTGEPGTYWQSNLLSWPTVKGGLRVTYDYGYQVIPQGLIDVSCRLAQQYLENPALMMQRRIGDSEARFSGSGGLVLNQLDERILDRFTDVGLA